MTNNIKKAFDQKLNVTVECWEKVPVIVNGIDSFNFYYANAAQHKR